MNLLGNHGIGSRILGNQGSRARREHYLLEITSRVMGEIKQKLLRDGTLSLEVIINDALYQEQERLRQEKSSQENEEAKEFWVEIGSRFLHVDDAEREAILRSIISRYVEEIHGSFNHRLHGIVARIVPWLLKALLHRLSPTTMLTWVSDRLNIEDNLVISGPLDSIRELASKGTLIMAPTHVSNLDSVVIGSGLYLSRLPPFTYGAGLNLFTNPVISYFMNNLGAYKVDRRKKNEIYKATLKQYATLSMEQGEHNLFFPGGTRCRRGDIEQHLKLGLLGCGVRVYTHNLQQDKAKPDVFVIPVNLSYGLVLEAKSLIEEHLKEEGKSRFIRMRNRRSGPMRLLNFWRNLTRMHSKIHLHFGEPVDLFGNAVGPDGQSRDMQGRVIDRRQYVMVNGMPQHESQRDQEYTRELGRALVSAYLRNNVILATHVAAFTAFHFLRLRNPAYDLYRFLRTEGKDSGIEADLMLRGLERTLEVLRELDEDGKLQLEPKLKTSSAQTLFETAMAHFKTYHDGKTLCHEDGKVFSLDMKLLYYYRNRLDHYRLESRLA
jgi:glycerol-3-phosphate O-acyltransferase